MIKVNWSTDSLKKSPKLFFTMVGIFILYILYLYITKGRGN